MCAIPWRSAAPDGADDGLDVVDSDYNGVHPNMDRRVDIGTPFAGNAGVAAGRNNNWMWCDAAIANYHICLSHCCHV